MAAMMCSTGSPAAFLHPAEAVHGDLGIHQKEDPVNFFIEQRSNTRTYLLRTSPEKQGCKNCWNTRENQ